ncbi:hypothetical protein ACFLRC_04605 [Candidatus Altiarchaeota archaeon]
MKYETITTHYIDYGRNKFLEISKKKILPEDNEFINIAKGYYTPKGDRRYQRGIGFPLQEEIISDLVEKLELIKQEKEAE